MGNHLTGSGLPRKQANRKRTRSEAHPLQGIESVTHVDSFRMADVGFDVFTSRLSTLEKRLSELGAEEVGELG